MRSIRIPVRTAVPYEVWVGAGHLSKLGSLVKRLFVGTDAVLVSNPTLKRQVSAVRRSLLRSGFPSFLLTIPDTERAKSMAVLGRLLVSMARFDGPGRRLFLVAVGGGVVGDVGGVAAGLYRRGVPYVQVPTTLLAQVDSSIGGKTGVDLPQGKNLVGLFFQPRLVFSEVSFLATLPKRQFASGLSEAAKCGVIADPSLFRLLEKHSVRALKKPGVLSQVIARAIRVKVRLVEEDERETRGRRTLLNFGHTFGHALEAATHYAGRYTHGEAVAIGMRVASEISKDLGLLSQRECERIVRLLSHLGLPTGAGGVSSGNILRHMAQDKKWAKAPGRWVLPTAIGRAVVVSRVKEDVVRRAIARSQGA